MHTCFFFDRDTVTQHATLNNKLILQILHILRPHPFDNPEEPDDNDAAVSEPTRDRDDDDDDDDATPFVILIASLLWRPA